MGWACCTGCAGEPASPSSLSLTLSKNTIHTDGEKTTVKVRGLQGTGQAGTVTVQSLIGSLSTGAVLTLDARAEATVEFACDEAMDSSCGTATVTTLTATQGNSTQSRVVSLLRPTSSVDAGSARDAGVDTTPVSWLDHKAYVFSRQCRSGEEPGAPPSCCATDGGTHWYGPVPSCANTVIVLPDSMVRVPFSDGVVPGTADLRSSASSGASELTIASSDIAGVDLHLSGLSFFSDLYTIDREGRWAWHSSKPALMIDAYAFAPDRAIMLAADAGAVARSFSSAWVTSTPIKQTDGITYFFMIH